MLVEKHEKKIILIPFSKLISLEFFIFYLMYLKFNDFVKKFLEKFCISNLTLMYILLIFLLLKGYEN